MKKLVYLLALLSCWQIVLAQQDSSYFPLAVGNKWIYRAWNFDNGYYDNYSTCFEIIGTEVINDTTYYVAKCKIFSSVYGKDYFRKDTLGNIYTRCQNKDVLFLKPSPKIYDTTIKTPCRSGFRYLEYEFHHNFVPWGHNKVRTIGYMDNHLFKVIYAFTRGYGCLEGNFLGDTPLVLKRAINNGIIVTPQVTGIISIRYDSIYRKILLHTMAVMDTTNEILLISKKQGNYKGSLVRFRLDQNSDYSYGPSYSIVSNLDLTAVNDTIKITVPATVSDILGDKVDGNSNLIWEGSPVDDYVTTIIIPKLTRADNINEPLNYKLLQNYPNPFNPSTKISYSLDKAGFVTLKIYDVLGREITTLVNEYQIPGNYEATFDANAANKLLSSGMYIYKLQVNNFIESKKMIFAK